jgi:hypothetical protein
VLTTAASLPVRTDARGKTEGIMFGGDDRVLRDEQFAAEPDGRLRSRQIRVGNRPVSG